MKTRKGKEQKLKWTRKKKKPKIKRKIISKTFLYLELFLNNNFTKQKNKMYIINVRQK